jgi:hypothetical protein
MLGAKRGIQTQGKERFSGRGKHGILPRMNGGILPRRKRGILPRRNRRDSLTVGQWDSPMGEGFFPRPRTGFSRSERGGNLQWVRTRFFRGGGVSPPVRVGWDFPEGKGLNPLAGGGGGLRGEKCVAVFLQGGKTEHGSCSPTCAMPVTLMLTPC